METHGRSYNTEGGILELSIRKTANDDEGENQEITQIFAVLQQHGQLSVKNDCLHYLHNFSNYFKTMRKRFDFSEHDELKKYLAGAAYNKIENLSKKKNLRIKKYYNKIRYNSELYSEAIGVIEVEIHCICLVNFNKNGSEFIAIRDVFQTTPVFVVKKCRGPDNNDYCRVIIDTTLKVYPAWKNFLKENDLPSSVICAPVNGRYSYNENDELHVEFIPTPRTKWRYIIWRVIDVLATLTFLAAGITSKCLSNIDLSTEIALASIAGVQVAFAVIRLIYIINARIKYKALQWCKNKDPVKYQHIKRELVKCEKCPGHYFKNKKQNS